MRRLLFLMLGVLFASAQLLAQRTITGTVSDSTGQGIPRASVRISGSASGTTTDARGAFTLSVPQGARSLEISSVGYLPTVIGIPASGNVNLSLRPDPANLTEVVITGINRVRRDRFSGAASKIEQKDIANRPVGSFDQLFQGRVPGVLSLSSSGQPGTSSNIIIRGTNTIAGTSTPLYVIDGIPVEASVFQSINPNDFESIDVLRDASTTALYGSRGSAGVIVVTTKRGKSGKMQLSYDGQFGVKTRPQFTVEMMTSAQLLKAQEDYGIGANVTAPSQTNLPGWFYSPNRPGYSSLPAATQALYASRLDSLRNINTNWRDVFFRDGNFSNHQISLSGGTGKTRLYSSLALYNEQGTTYRTDMKRATWRGNVDYQDDKLTFQVSSQVGYTKRNFQQSTTTNSTGNPFLVSSITVPYTTLYVPGTTNYNTGTGAKFAGANAYELTMLDANYSDQIKTTIGTTASYKITNDITAGVVAGVDFRETQSSNYGNKTAYLRRTSTTPTGQAGFQSENLNRNVILNVRPSIGYRKVVGTKSDLDVTLYGEYLKNAYKRYDVTGYGIDPRTPNTPAAITQGNGTNQLYASITNGDKEQNTTISGLLIGRYTYDNKYTINASYRRDASSKLPTATRWQGFYSVGLVWDAMKESFLSNNRIANTLRVRASYGGAGNSDNFPGDSYPYQSRYVAGTTVSGLNGQVVSYPGYDQLKWETTWTANFGIDFGFLKNRIYGSVDIYDRTTRDLFVDKSLAGEGTYSPGVGFNILRTNAGELQNRGIEVVANAEVIRSKNVLWTVFGNFALNRNKVTSLGGEASYESGTELLTVGLPLGSHYEVKWGGVDAATGQPLYYDLNGNLTTVYNASNAVQEFGTWEAPWKGGFGTRLNYKSFEVSTLFSWQRGANKVDNLEYFTENPVGFLGVGYNQSNTLNFWKKPGDIVSTPSPLYSVNFSSKIIHNADFLRWKDLVVAYNIPSRILSKTRIISNVRIYVQGTNLLIWTKWRGMDPEAGAVNINLSEFPNARAYTAGITVGF